MRKAARIPWKFCGERQPVDQVAAYNAARLLQRRRPGRPGDNRHLRKPPTLLRGGSVAAGPLEPLLSANTQRRPHGTLSRFQARSARPSHTDGSLNCCAGMPAQGKLVVRQRRNELNAVAKILARSCDGPRRPESDMRTADNSNARRMRCRRHLRFCRVRRSLADRCASARPMDPVQVLWRERIEESLAIRPHKIIDRSHASDWHEHAKGSAPSSTSSSATMNAKSSELRPSVAFKLSVPQSARFFSPTRSSETERILS